jgi:serine/threonine protein phosphatase PrpC
VSLAFDVAAKTDVGCVRVSNEDNFGYDLDHGVFIVCDGIGGQAAGEVASQIAVDSLLHYFREFPQHQTHTHAKNGRENMSERAMAVAEAIQLANTAIREAACGDEGKTGMGSTVVCVLVDQNVFSVGHVGDSRVYLIRGGAIEQLTQDHSLVVQQMRLGLISSEQAEKSKLQNVITQALGSEETVEPDLDDMIAVSDDVLLLASDGLTRMLGDQEILAVITSAADLEHACNDLIQSAKEAGGDDNITCVLIRLVEQRWYQTCLRKFRQLGARNGTSVSQI